MKRPDGRSPAAMRPPKVVFGPLSRADGSAKFMSGSSCWVAAVYGPKEGPGGGGRAVEKDVSKAAVEVVVRPAAGQVLIIFSWCFVHFVLDTVVEFGICISDSFVLASKHAKPNRAIYYRSL